MASNRPHEALALGDLASIIFTFILSQSLLHQTSASAFGINRPSMTLSTNDNLDEINVGETIRINCTVTVPEGYRIGYRNFPVLSKVSWAQSLIKDITINTTIPFANQYPRISVSYSNITTEHTYQLEFSNIQRNDSGFYFCTAPVSHVTGFPSLFLREYVYISVGDLLSTDVPRCSMDPDEIVLEETSATPICFLKRDDDIPKIVQWNLLYPDGRTERRSGYSLTNLRGLNFERYTFTVSDIDISYDGVIAVCTVVFPYEADLEPQSCNIALTVIESPKIISTNLLGADVGDSMSMEIILDLPPESGYTVTGSSWSKIINSDYRLITNNADIVSNHIDHNRYDAQIVHSDGLYSNTVTVSDVQDEDAGFYHGLLSVSSLKTEYSYLKYVRITVGDDLSEEFTPLCEISPEKPSSDNVLPFICTIKRTTTNRPVIDITWTLVTSQGDVETLTSYREDLENYVSLKTQIPVSSYESSTLICAVSSSDLPDLYNNCTLGPFMDTTIPPTTEMPTTVPSIVTQPNSNTELAHRSNLPPNSLTVELSTLTFNTKVPRVRTEESVSTKGKNASDSYQKTDQPNSSNTKPSGISKMQSEPSIITRILSSKTLVSDTATKSQILSTLRPSAPMTKNEVTSTTKTFKTHLVTNMDVTELPMVSESLTEVVAPQMTQENMNTLDTRQTESSRYTQGSVTTEKEEFASGAPVITSTPKPAQQTQTSTMQIPVVPTTISLVLTEQLTLMADEPTSTQATAKTETMFPERSTHIITKIMTSLDTNSRSQNGMQTQGSIVTMEPDISGSTLRQEMSRPEMTSRNMFLPPSQTSEKPAITNERRTSSLSGTMASSQTQRTMMNKTPPMVSKNSHSTEASNLATILATSLLINPSVATNPDQVLTVKKITEELFTRSITPSQEYPKSQTTNLLQTPKTLNLISELTSKSTNDLTESFGRTDPRNTDLFTRTTSRTVPQAELTSRMDTQERITSVPMSQFTSENYPPTLISESVSKQSKPTNVMTQAFDRTDHSNTDFFSKTLSRTVSQSSMASRTAQQGGTNFPTNETGHLQTSGTFVSENVSKPINTMTQISEGQDSANTDLLSNPTSRTNTPNSIGSGTLPGGITSVPVSNNASSETEHPARTLISELASTEFVSNPINTITQHSDKTDHTDTDVLSRTTPITAIQGDIRTRTVPKENMTSMPVSNISTNEPEYLQTITSELVSKLLSKSTNSMTKVSDLTDYSNTGTSQSADNFPTATMPRDVSKKPSRTSTSRLMPISQSTKSVAQSTDDAASLNTNIASSKITVTTKTDNGSISEGVLSTESPNPLPSNTQSPTIISQQQNSREQASTDTLEYDKSQTSMEDGDHRITSGTTTKETRVPNQGTVLIDEVSLISIIVAPIIVFILIILFIMVYLYRREKYTSTYDMSTIRKQNKKLQGC